MFAKTGRCLILMKWRKVGIELIWKFFSATEKSPARIFPARIARSFRLIGGRPCPLALSFANDRARNPMPLKRTSKSISFYLAYVKIFGLVVGFGWRLWAL
jgi:hypothetical protein